MTPASSSATEIPAARLCYPNLPVPPSSPRARLAVAAGLGLAGVWAGCGGSGRPSQFGDVPPPSGAYTAGPPPSLDLDSAALVPMCNLGPEGGVCACVDQPLLVDPPNLYFVLDRSGSMAEMNKWINVQLALEKLTTSLGPRARVGAAVFPSPFPSANGNGCAPGGEVFAPRAGDAPAGTEGPTEAALITVLGRISAAGGTPMAATLS